MAKTFRTNQNLIGTGFRQSSGDTLTLSGNTVIGACGSFKYATCQHSRYTSRSVTDAEYVTGRTAALRNIGSVSQVIYRGGNGITGATNFTYNPATSGVTVPNLYISITPPDDTCLDYILSWDDNYKQVRKIPYSTAAGLTCGCNGLTSSGGVVRLGGALCEDTVINGINNYSLRFCDMCGMCAISTSNNIVIDSRNCSGGLYLKSQCGAGSLATNFSCAVGISIDYQANHGFLIHDNRDGCLQSGIEYAGNYATFYTPRSLVDKNYVDTVASGLQPHPAVIAATTENIALSGVTLPVVIDNVNIVDGDRVLIKNQTQAKNNGIYVLTGTTFVRSYDFNESSESVQGAYTFVMSGATNKSTSWVLSTPNPIALGVTPLNFNIFSQITDIDVSTGLCLSVDYGKHTIWVDGQGLAGNSICWSGNTFNVDPNGENLATALSRTVTGGTNGIIRTGQNLGLGGTLTGDTTLAGATLKYDNDYSSQFTDHTLVDKQYVDQNISSGGTYNLQSPAAIAVGGIGVGFALSGKTAFELFEALLVPELCGTITAPSTSIALSKTGTYEVGCVLSQTVTATFNRGSISPQYCSASAYRSGCANAYCFTGSGMPAGLQSCALSPASQTNAAYTVINGSQSWGICTRYSAGSAALGSKGTQYCAALSSGCTSAASASITGLYPYYYGKLESASRPAVTNTLVANGTKVVASSTGTITVSFNSAASEWTWFAIPAISTSKSCWYVNALDNGRVNTAPSDKYPDECQICVTSAQGCWTNICYKVYMSKGIGAITAPMEFRN